jgi:hypothetical protein
MTELPPFEPDTRSKVSGSATVELAAMAAERVVERRMVERIWSREVI